VTRTRPSVLVVDDHAPFRRAVRGLLTASGFDVVGEAADGDEAVRMAAATHPRLVLLDIQLPDRDGFAVAEELDRLPVPPVIVLISRRGYDRTRSAPLSLPDPAVQRSGRRRVPSAGAWNPIVGSAAASLRGDDHRGQSMSPTRSQGREVSTSWYSGNSSAGSNSAMVTSRSPRSFCFHR
jgi:CheY-like chemotaxis protein